MNGVAIDWIAENIYWTDGQYKIIGVQSPVSAWKAIVDSNLSAPQDIVVNPSLRSVDADMYMGLVGLRWVKCQHCTILH